jgi:hypothetical protein
MAQSIGFQSVGHSTIGISELPNDRDLWCRRKRPKKHLGSLDKELPAGGVAMQSKSPTR